MNELHCFAEAERSIHGRDWQLLHEEVGLHDYGIGRNTSCGCILRESIAFKLRLNMYNRVSF